MLQLRQGTVSVHDALDSLLSLSAVKTFCQKWEDEPLFRHHAKRYILALRPDSGIAFHETDRYKNPRGLSKSRREPPAAVAAKLRRDPSTFIEVGVFATRAFKKGEVVNLRGGIADLTEEEDDEMRDEGGRSDFSVLWSQRKECFCLLLGPARFVNHDCRNNVEFQLTGTNMAFKVLEDIAKDEELFTHYGASLRHCPATLERARSLGVRAQASTISSTTTRRACVPPASSALFLPRFSTRLLFAHTTSLPNRLKQGAFAPARPKPAAAPKPRASSPTPASRRSRRASTIAAPDYNESRALSSAASAAAAVPRAGRGAGLARSASTSSVPTRSPGRPRPRSSRMNPTRGELSPADALRGQPRLIVQPKLPPPPGYARDYVWDAKKRIARYTGPKVSPVAENAGAPPKQHPLRKPASSSSSAAPAAVTLGKRRRGSTAPAATAESSPAPRSKSKAKPASSSAASPRPAKKPRTSQVQLKQVRLGERSSQRKGASAGTASARDREFAKLRQAMGRADEAADSSELSEAEEEGEGEGEDGNEEEDEEVQALLSPQRAGTVAGAGGSPLPFAMPASSSHDREESSASVTLSVAPTRSSRSVTSDTTASGSASSVAFRSVTCDVAMSTSTPIEETHPAHVRRATSEEEHEDKVILCDMPSSDDKDKGKQQPASPRGPILAPASNFYASAAGPSDSGGGGGGEPGPSGSGAPQQQQRQDQEDFRSGPTSGGGGRNASGSALGGLSGGLGSGGGGAGGGGGDDGDDRRQGKRPEPVDEMDVDEAEEEEQKPTTGGDEQDEGQGKGGAAAPSGEVQAASEGAPAGASGVPSDPEDAAAALLMLLCAPCAPPRPRTPSSTAPTPPHTEPSQPSASTSASGEASSSMTTTARSNVRRGRASDESSSRPSPGPSLNPRSTRRHSKLPEPPTQDPAPSTSAASKGKKKARISDAAPPAPASEGRRTSTRGSGARTAGPSQQEAPPSLEARRTRSQPLPGKLEDVLYAPETLAATGGYDWEKGRCASLPFCFSLLRTLLTLGCVPADVSKFEAVRDPSHNPLPPRRPSPTPSPSPSPPPPPARKPLPAFKPSRPSPRPAISAPAKAPTPRASAPPTSHAARAVISSSQRATSAATPVPSQAPPEGVRSTRRSFPIAGPLRDLIHSPAAVAANGGWDAAAGKYVSAASAASQAASAASPAPPTGRRRASSASADGAGGSASSSRKRPASPALAAPTSSSAPPADVRSTRRSFPMAHTKVSDLVYSPAARLVSGGWDPVSGKYVSAAKGEASSTSSPAGAAAASGSRGARRGG